MEIAAAAALLAVAIAMPLLFGTGHPLGPGVTLGLIVAHALASRIRLYLGTGYVMPTQLVLFPMLFMAGPAMVPALVACGLALAALPDVARGREHPERLVTAVADSWHAVGPSLAFVAAGQPAPGLDAVPLVGLALATQFAGDLLSSTAREHVGRGTAPALQAQVIALVCVMDICLTPAGVLIAAAGTQRPIAAFIVILPLLALLAAFASDRRARIDEAVSRADQLREERARLDETIRRVGEAFASGLDRRALADLMLTTAVDALNADVGRTTMQPLPVDGAVPEALAEALASAERAAACSGEITMVQRGPHVAMAHPLSGAETGGAPDALVVARTDRPFSEDEQALFGYLANQAAVAMDNVALHAQLRRQATVDELTDLANHRRFQETLQREAERSRRSGRPLALIMIDIDNFKSVNDTYGHPQGDLVLRRVAEAVRRTCRVTDHPARYGGEELAVVLPDTNGDGGHRLAEKIRQAVEALEMPTADGTPLQVTVSLGVAATEGEAAGAKDVVARADAALYEAKRTGKNRTVVADRHHVRRQSRRFRADSASPDRSKPAHR